MKRRLGKSPVRPGLLKFAMAITGTVRPQAQWNSCTRRIPKPAICCKLNLHPPLTTAAHAQRQRRTRRP